ncbi:glycosyltransferase family 2 protein [Bacillus sp. USDA818B3_A]|uniref:glycosyltransferase family 2 protein n=1 Tax=Bacillus sp. USDA818B3_A TaxID=2698834 RepID=UPI001369D4B1|nr:glycosyltransferase family 2 protein [Bacillus sp. USDA818B3_A]
MSITVVIPTYNRANKINKSIESVMEQTYPVDEIIIVDDFSTDHTEQVVRSFNNEKIKYVVNSFKKGANGARNTGIMMAKGQYIAFQDSDDRWLPEKIAKQYHYMMEHPSVDLCFCSMDLIGSKRGIVPKRQVTPKEMATQLEKGNFISTQTIFTKNNVAKSILFDEDLKRFQDWDFVLRVVREYNIHHLNEILVEVEVQEDSISKTINEVEALKKFFTKYPYLTKTHLVNKSLYYKILVHDYIIQEQAGKSILSLLKYNFYRYFDKVINQRVKL